MRLPDTCRVQTGSASPVGASNEQGLYSLADEAQPSPLTFGYRPGVSLIVSLPAV
jgi:hypothetical protein